MRKLKFRFFILRRSRSFFVDQESCLVSRKTMDVVGLITPTILLCLDHSQLESNFTCLVSRAGSTRQPDVDDPDLSPL